jgi:predicted hydrocarbon binding protein
MIANISMRAELDAIVGIMGHDACRVLYRQARLSHIFQNPPRYDFSPCISEEEGHRLDGAIIDLVGINGAIAIWRRIGYRAIQCAVEIGRVQEHIEDGVPEERFLKSLELYALSIGAGGIIQNDDLCVAFERPECPYCRGIEYSKPVCSLTEGVLDYLAEQSFGKNVYRARETKCKAMGDDTCYYVLEEREESCMSRLGGGRRDR